MEDTKLLVAGAASSQEKLAQAAQSSAKTITQLTDVVKLGAASMGSEDPETQVCVGCWVCVSIELFLWLFCFPYLWYWKTKRWDVFYSGPKFPACLN